MIPIQKVNILARQVNPVSGKTHMGQKSLILADPKASTNTTIKRKQRKLSPTHIEQHPIQHRQYLEKLHPGS